MELSAKPIANPAVIFQEQFDHWAVLVNLDTAGAVALNPTGVVVWKLIDGQRSVVDIVTAVEGHFKNVPDTVADDVSALLDALAEDGFVGFEWALES
jgi:hypothetical protein